MRQSVFTVQFLGACVALAILAGDLPAQPPLTLRHYEFLPRLSTLAISGGFAGIHQESPIIGEFDFVTGLKNPCPDCGLIPFAEFRHVDASYLDPFPPPDNPQQRADLDAALNLSGLRGVPGDFSSELQYFFDGVEGQGYPIDVVLTIHDREIHIAGQSVPGQCCDQFVYDIDAVALLVPFGDYDGDGGVDWRDYDVWKETFGSTTDMRADGNSDNMVSTADYTLWRDTIGQMVTSSAADATVSMAVPEPASVWILCSLHMMAMGLGLGNIGTRVR